VCAKLGVVHSGVSGNRGGGSIDAEGVISALDGIVAERGTPVYLIMDNGDEFISYSLERWAEEMGVTLYIIDSGSPWQNGKCESFNSRLRDELLNVELFTSVTEAQLVTNKCRHDYNQYRAHSSLGYSSPHEFMALDVKTQRMVLNRSGRQRGFYAEN
jgi:putative transposase